VATHTKETALYAGTIGCWKGHFGPLGASWFAERTLWAPKGPGSRSEQAREEQPARPPKTKQSFQRLTINQQVISPFFMVQAY